MASYKVIPKPSVEKDLRSLPKSSLRRLIQSLELLASDPFPRQALKLEGEQLYRLPANWRLPSSLLSGQESERGNRPLCSSSSGGLSQVVKDLGSIVEN